MNRKIVITSNTSWFVFNFFSSSITEFMKGGNEIFIVAQRDKYSEKLESLGCKFFDINLDRSGMNLLSELKTIRSIYKHLRDLSPDCVLNFTPKLNIYSVLLCKYLRIPVINSVAGLGYIVLSNGFKSVLGKSLLRLTQPFADHIIFQNNDDLAVYLSNKWVVREKTSRVKGIGVDLKKFTPSKAKDDGVVRFLLFARMLKSKGVMEFVEAANIVASYFDNDTLNNTKPKVAFSLLGFIDEHNPDGISKTEICFLHTGTIVRYLGETDNVIDHLKNYDCVVLPSYYREGIPQCLIEAASMAKPIITTNNVGCRETVVDQVTGYLVPPKDVARLSEAMINMTNLGHEQRLQMGQAGRIKAENDFCHRYVAKHYLRVIESVVTENGDKTLIKQEA